MRGHFPYNEFTISRCAAGAHLACGRGTMPRAPLGRTGLGHGPHLSAREELVALAVPEGAGGRDDVGHGCAAIGEDAAHERAGEVDSLVIEGDVEGDEVR